MAETRTDLGKIFITNGGTYDATVTYEKLTMVSYNNSTYITLRTVTGVTPSDDRVNYLLMAQGFTATYLASVTAIDQQGIATEAGDEISAQLLINAIADRVANQLVSNSDLQDTLLDYVAKSAVTPSLNVTEDGKVLDAKAGKALNDALGNKLDLAVSNNSIQASENLDSYTTPGKYACLSASVAETLANCPITYAFVLIVEYGMSNQYIKQTIYGYAAGGGTIPVFSRKNVAGAWATWYGGEITSGKNMNTYEFPGRYVCNSASIATSLTNSPANSAFVLDVELGMNKFYVIQTVSVYSVANIPIYKRVRTSGTWGNWVQIH